MRTILSAWICIGFAWAACAEPAWDIPDPMTTEHAGAAEAPASSPATYPDAAGFAERSRTVLDGLVTVDLGNYRKGYFSGGDPGKYLPGHAMARLLLNPDDPEPAKYMNDQRSYKEHYHFATVNWARFYPIFGDKVLTEETKQKFAEAGFKYGSYHSHSGTENHKTMWWTSACVLPQFTGKGLSRRNKEASLRMSKQTLREYVKTLLHHGAGEWDSSTYLMFTANGLMNIYDFSDDPEMRLLAKAGLDCMLTSYALKYTDGVFCAPNQRGFARGPYQTIADATGYVWWGGHKALTPDDTRGMRYTIHPITSSYRPNAVMTNLARKTLPNLPAEFRNRRANYWHGQSIPAKPGAHESLYIDRHFTMGTLWDAHASQHTRFQLVVSTPEGGVPMTMGHPRKTDHKREKTGLGYRDGISRYAQFAQVGPTAVMLAMIPDDEEVDYVFFTVPDGVEVKKDGPNYTMMIGQTQVTVTPLGGAAGVVNLPKVGKRSGEPRAIKVVGRRVGFRVHAGTADEAKQLKEVATGLGVPLANMDDAQPEAYGAQWITAGPTTYRMQFNPDQASDRHGDRLPLVSKLVEDANGKDEGWEPVTWRDGAVIDGPYVQQVNGVMSVNDGKQGFIIDFTGDLPVYKPWKPE